MRFQQTIINDSWNYHRLSWQFEQALSRERSTCFISRNVSHSVTFWGDKHDWHFWLFMCFARDRHESRNDSQQKIYDYCSLTQINLFVYSAVCTRENLVMTSPYEQTSFVRPSVRPYRLLGRGGDSCGNPNGGTELRIPSFLNRIFKEKDNSFQFVVNDKGGWSNVFKMESHWNKRKK